MTTSPSFTLSPDAKEFVPFVQIPLPIPIPVYVNETSVTPAYSAEQTPQLIYPVLNIPEIEYHVHSPQQFHLGTHSNHNRTQPSNNANPSPIVLLPTTAFYPVNYVERPMPNYSLHQQKTFNNHPNDRPNSNSSQRRRKFPLNNQQQTSNKTFEKSKTERSNPTNDGKHRYEFRPEDFPSLTTNNQNSKPTPPSTSSTPIASWNAVASRSRTESVSPHSTTSSTKQSQRKDSSKLKNRSKKKDKSSNPSKKTTTVNTNKPVVAKQNPPNTTKADDEAKRKQLEEKSASQEQEQPVNAQSIPFSLDDESIFPALGQELTTSKTKASNNDSSIKEKPSTPGIIPKSKVKANQSYQICLTDMFNALSIATQVKREHSTHENKKPIISANPLDSNPVPKRGKEREKPKSRKPTKLKRIINKELEENKKQRQQLLIRSNGLQQDDNKDASCVVDVDDSKNHASTNEYTSTSCTEESANESDDEILDHQPTSQIHTPCAQQLPQSNIKQQIHDSGFREYCSQLINRQLDELCIQLLITLKRFQDRKKQQLQLNPERARRKRRFVHGIREVTKHLRLQRLKCVLIAPDCQSIKSQGGLDDAIGTMLDLCKEQDIPYIFTLNRQKLGRCLNKTSRISVIGIFDYSGADQIYKQVVDIAQENQNAYKQIIENIASSHDEMTTTTPFHGLNSREFYKILHRTFQQQQQPRQHVVNTIPNESLSKALPTVPAHYAHSRQTSDTSTIYIDQQLINAIAKQHTRASSGTFDMGKPSTNKKSHQRTLSDGAANIVQDTSVQTKHHLKTHSRTPSGCSVISQIEQQDYFEQSKNIIMNTNVNETDNDEYRLKSIHEDTEEYAANIKRKNVEKWINDN